MPHRGRRHRPPQGAVPDAPPAQTGAWPRPPWRADWARITDLAAVAASAGFAILDPAAVQPGDVVALRLTRGAPPHHLAILASAATIVHAVEGAGVVEVHLSSLAQRISLAAAFPLE